MSEIFILTDLSLIPGKQRHQNTGGQNTVIGMKLSPRASTSIFYVCSLERNAGKIYWCKKRTHKSR